MTDIENVTEAKALVDRYWERLLELDPLIGTECGDERYDDRLSDPSEAGRARAEGVHRDALRDLARIDRDGIEPELGGTLDILEATAGRYLQDIEHRTDRLEAVSHLFGPSQLLGVLGSIQLADTPARLDRYVGRLHAIAAFLASCADVARDGAGAGVTAPRLVVERSIAQVERLLATPVDDSPALEPVGEDAAARDRVAAVVRDTVNPAYERFLETLRDYLPHATETIGVSELPDGMNLYRAQIRAWTSLDMDPEAIHQIGFDRFEAIQSERESLAAGLGYDSPSAAIKAHTASGLNTAGSKEDFLALAERQVARSWEVARGFFGRMPRDNCEVRLVEEFREADMPLAFYNSPTADGSRPGIYHVNGYDLPNRPLHHLATTTCHEANPGHHFQLSIEQELEDRPALRRFGGILAGSAFCEGWGLYSERLADEMELYEDEFERLGMLDAQAFRAGRLITDTGIHALGWTRDQAIAKLEEGGVAPVDAVIEVDRYISMPGQALAYMIGMIEIENARRAAEERDGATFSLRDFHDRLLGLGQLPLAALRRALA